MLVKRVKKHTCKHIYITYNRLDITCPEFCKTMIYFSLSQIHLWYVTISWKVIAFQNKNPKSSLI